MRNLTILFIAAILFCCSCAALKNPYASISDTQARAIIEKSIQAYGGLDNWKDIDYMSFDKWYALYDDQGYTEVNVTQQHHYTPEKKYMTWPGEDGKVEQIKYKNEFTRTVNGEPDKSANVQSIKNSMLAALFVVDLPFNLLDKTATIVYEGESEFNGKPVYVVRAEYHPDRVKKHTTKDIWWHYFDTESYISQGYKVKHLDHVSQVVNQTFYTVNGFTLPGKRQSFRVDEDGNELFLRAEYEYTNYRVKVGK